MKLRVSRLSKEDWSRMKYFISQTPFNKKGGNLRIEYKV